MLTVAGSEKSGHHVTSCRAASSVRSSFSVEIVTRAELRSCDIWRAMFANQRKDHRYYEIVEDTLRDNLEYRYLAIVDGVGRIRAVQPFFLLDQDILEGLGPERLHLVSFIRRTYPRFLKLRTLMVGCSAGEGHLAETADLAGSLVAEVLSRNIVRLAKSLKAQLVVLKEFPVEYRGALDCFRERGFARAPSMPMTKLNIDYDSFETYIQTALSGNARRHLRKNLKATAGVSDIRMSVVEDASDSVDEMHPLYLQVYERSKFHFEKLTGDYFRHLGQRMKDKVRFFMWRRGNTLIAFGLCMVQGDQIFSECIGLDYAVAIDLHLYHYINRGIISWAMSNGYKWYHSSGLNYDPKLHMRHRLDPIDLYVRHTSPLANIVLKAVLPWIVPANYDAKLKMFSNYRDLW